LPLRTFDKIIPMLKTASGQVQLFFTFSGSKQRALPHLDIILEDCAFQDTARQLSWSKVDGRVRISRDRLIVNELWAFLNNFPIRFTGELRRIGHPRLIAELTTYPGQVPGLRAQNPLNLGIRFLGDVDAKGGYGNLWLTNFIYGEKGDIKEKWKFSVHELRAGGPLSPKALSEGVTLTSQGLLVRNERPDSMFDHFSMRKAKFFISSQPETFRCDLTEGTFNRGALFLQTWLKMGVFPDVSWTASGALSEADAASLASRFNQHIPVSGRLSAEGTWHQDKNHSQFSGRFRLFDGEVGPTAALEQLANETGIEPLRQIRFQEYSGYVVYRDGDLNLNDVHLRSDEADLKANVKMKEGRLVGTLSAKFTEPSVRKSSDLRRLLRYLGEKDWVDFDFRIVGTRSAPRIQWLTGEFKRKVEAKLPPFLRKRLAREMEKLLLERRAAKLP
ncbi:MAG: hypothetical protein ABH845_02010, partial [Candidatus Omnitrophota bacterium]